MAIETKLRNNENNSNECILVPATDIYESTDGYTLKVEMPGVIKDNFDIILEKDELEIKGKIVNDNEEGKELRYAEYPLHDYYRKFNIGNDIDRDKVEAKLDNGVLTLVFSKNEKVKPRKIDVKLN